VAFGTESLGKMDLGKTYVMPLRLAILSTSFLPKIGGLQIVLNSQLEAIDRNFSFLARVYGLEHAVFLVPREFESEALNRFQHIEVQYFDLGTSVIGKFWTRRRLRTLLIDRKINVIHGHNVAADGLVIPNNPSVWAKVFTTHGADLALVPEANFGARLSLRGKIAVKIGLWKVDRLVAVSSTMQQFAEQLVSPSKILKIHDFLSPEFGNLRAKSRAHQGLVRRLGPDLVLLTLGGARELKGHKRLILAFTEFLKLFPNSKLLIGSTGELFDDIAKLIAELRIQHACHFIGEVEGIEKQELFERADIYLNTSLFEAFGLTSLEAVATQTAVLAPDLGGPREIFRHKETAFLCDPTSVKNIVGGLIFLSSSSNRNRLVSNSQELLSRYSEEKWLNTQFEMYGALELERR